MDDVENRRQSLSSKFLSLTLSTLGKIKGRNLLSIIKEKVDTSHLHDVSFFIH